MEGLAPPLEFLLELRLHLANGHSTREALQLTLKACQNSFIEDVRIWLSLVEKGLNTQALIERQTSPYRRILLRILENGLKGQPIDESLLDLQTEMHTACCGELEEHYRRLPVLAVLPVLVFMFPAFFILLFGPLTLEFLKHLEMP